MIEGLVAGLGSLLGGIGSSIIGANSQADANEANIQSAQRQMEFQERMYKNRYQMQMKDMRDAGLNPLLAAGAQPPGPPSGASGNSVGFSPSDPITPAINASILAENSKANLAVSNSQVAKNIQDAQTSAAQASKTAVETGLLMKDLPQSEIKYKIMNYLKRNLNDFMNTNGKQALDNVNRVMNDSKKLSKQLERKILP